MLSVDEAVGSTETSSYTDGNGVQTVTFNDIRRYSAVLMAFPIKAAAQPYLGVGYGLIHVVNPTPSSSAAFQSDAVDLGSAGFATFVGGLQFQVGRFMAFGQYQITSGAASDERERQRRDGARGRSPALEARRTPSVAAFASAWAAPATTYAPAATERRD